MTKVFVSYSWDGPGHQRWVAQLASRLRDAGYDILLDQWSVAPGEDLPAFMERAVRDSGRVLLICTEGYKQRADNRRGGGGYETTLIAGEILYGISRDKFIPILRGAEWKDSAPSYLAASRYIDLRGDPYDEEAYVELTRALPRPPRIEPAVTQSTPPSIGAETPPIYMAPRATWKLVASAVLIALALYVTPRIADNPQFQLSQDEVREAVHQYGAELMILLVPPILLMCSVVFAWARRRGSPVWHIRAFVLALLSSVALWIGQLNLQALQSAAAVDLTLPKLAWPLNGAIALAFLSLCAALWAFVADHRDPGR